MTDFDEIGVVVDWLDACRKRDLDAVLELYEPDATLDCICNGERSYRGVGQLRTYWAERLEGFSLTAPGIEDLHPADSGVLLDYSTQTASVRMHFSFSRRGKISHTRCEEMPGDGQDCSTC